LPEPVLRPVWGGSWILYRRGGGGARRAFLDGGADLDFTAAAVLFAHEVNADVVPHRVSLAHRVLGGDLGHFVDNRGTPGLGGLVVIVAQVYDKVVGGKAAPLANGQDAPVHFIAQGSSQFHRFDLRAAVAAKEAGDDLL